MALSDSILRMKDKVTGAVQNFFYPRDEYPRDDRTAGRSREGRRLRRNFSAPPRNEDQYAEEDDSRSQSAWSAPQVSESSPFQNTNPYTAPAQGSYQQQASYQAQPQGQFQQPQTYQQTQSPYQQPQGQYQPQAQNPYQQPQNPYQQQGRENGNILYFPNAPQGQAREATIRVVTARGIADCYGAITQLRLGDAVILVMDGINDPAEMRHYVDMLSGACYSLRATITKLSRHGAYLVCPQQVRVYVDAATNRLNSGARQSQRPLQNPYGQVRYADPYGRQDQVPADPYARQAAAQPINQNGRDYFGRTAMPDAQGTADHLQPYANGYMPDFPADEVRAQ